MSTKTRRQDVQDSLGTSAWDYGLHVARFWKDDAPVWGEGCFFKLLC